MEKNGFIETDNYWDDNIGGGKTSSRGDVCLQSVYLKNDSQFITTRMM